MTENEIIIQKLIDLSPDISARKMMGDHVVYYKGKVIGGVFDGRFAVKLTPTARSFAPNAKTIVPYPGAKEMLFIEKYDNEEFLTKLLSAIFFDIPEKKKKI